MKIRDAREKLGMSQAEFARALGVSPAAVGLWEQGRRSPNQDTALKIEALISGPAPLLDITALESLLGVSDWTIRDALRRSRMKGHQDGRGQWRATHEDALAWKRDFFMGAAPRRYNHSSRSVIPEGYAERIAAIRRSVGYTQQEFAELVGVADKNAISRWERGDHAPRPRHWRRIVDIEQRAVKKFGAE